MQNFLPFPSIIRSYKSKQTKGWNDRKLTYFRATVYVNKEAHVSFSKIVTAF